MVFVVLLVLCGCYFSVFVFYIGFKCYCSYNFWLICILIWGGLCGGFVLVMVFFIFFGIMVIFEKLIDVKELILVMIYVVVVFFILV